MYETEDITENMNDAGYDGNWLSVITPSMDIYRVTTEDRVYEVYDQEHNLVEGEQADKIINGVFYDPIGE